MIGTTSSHYKITEKLGGGGMGVVYKAQDTKHKRTVTLKFLSPDLTRDEELKMHFVNKAQAASGLQHNNICTIHGIEETTDGQTFIVMECYEGRIQKAKISEEPLPIDEASRIAIDVANGLSEAHAHRIIHRDIKPANIIGVLQRALAKDKEKRFQTPSEMAEAIRGDGKQQGGDGRRRRDCCMLGNEYREVRPGSNSLM